MFKQISDLIADVESEYNDVISENAELSRSLDEYENDEDIGIPLEEHNSVVAEYEEKIKILEEELAGARDTIAFVLFNKEKTTEA